MKIAGCTIQESKITLYNEITFSAHYKKRSIYVSSDHGFGEAKEPEKTRFYLSVIGDEGIYDVDYYDDFNNIEEAIEEALKGACLTNKD